MKDLLYSITRSSADPAAMSLAVRGLLVGFVPIIMSLAPIACSIIAALCFDLSVVNPLIDAIVKVVEGLLTVVAGVMFIWGVIRKMFLGRMVHPDVK